MIDGISFFDQSVKNDLQKCMKTFERLQLAKEIITQMAVC